LQVKVIVMAPMAAVSSRRRRSFLSVALASAAVLAAAVASFSSTDRQAPLSAPDAAAFVAGHQPQRSLLNRRLSVEDVESPVTMHGGSRRQNRYNHPKKLHPRYIEFLDRRNAIMTPFWLQKLTYKKEPTLEKWSQTLKLTFPEGEDDGVTEEEVMEFFTFDDVKPEAAIVGHRTPHDPLAHAYVHFATNEDCIKARKNKASGAIGKASEMKAVYTDEKKWIRLRDGVQLTGGPRASWMKAYGSQPIEEYGDNFRAESAGRSHPVYPE